MRAIPFITSFLFTIVLVYALNTRWGTAPPFGPFMSPQHGFWQNANASDHSYSQNLELDGLQDKVEVVFDERLVPHITTSNEVDAYFVQGYLHAKFRLFQMDLQTKAAEGRASEIAGEKALAYDREQRRIGMRFSAENALTMMEQDELLKPAYDAYTAGVNAFIETLTPATMPLEYKILDLQPEKWSNLRTSLLLKMMAKMLSGGTEIDQELEAARSMFSDSLLRLIYPQVHDSLVPIIPGGTIFPQAGKTIIPPPGLDSQYLATPDSIFETNYSRPNPSNGSNNWVLAGSRTSSGFPILCNDPHLELSLPSIWYELQLTTPTSNSYGVSLPGSPFIIIGFNDSISWGVTNSQRDVKDYYRVRFRDSSLNEYWYNGAWKAATFRKESIHVRGRSEPVIDSIPFTVFGPVLESGEISGDSTGVYRLALRWTAHDPSNEGRTFYYLNRARNYDDYLEALKTFSCPGQNFVFASHSGDIAIWQQGAFPARWDRQGLYIMPGEDSSYAWQGFIPQEENPHALNPSEGFLLSANQRPVDGSYPYFIPGTYITPRGVSIHRKLVNANNITPRDMQVLQNDYFNSLAEDARPLLVSQVKEENLDPDALRYLNLVVDWNLLAEPGSYGQTIYQLWWDSLEAAIWRDELSVIGRKYEWPAEQTTLEWLLRDSLMPFVDNIETPALENLADQVTLALNRAAVVLKQAELDGKLAWADYKNPTVYHLLKDALKPFARPGLKVGGNGNIINAITHSHGPSWRMVVHMVRGIEAYGVYPGGQEGNPGSRYYDMFINDWVAGKYYSLWFRNRGEDTGDKVRWTMNLSPL